MDLVGKVIVAAIKSPKWGYPSFSLLIALLTRSHEPLSTSNIQNSFPSRSRFGNRYFQRLPAVLRVLKLLRMMTLEEAKVT